MLKKILKGSMLFVTLLCVAAIVHFMELDVMLQDSWVETHLVEKGWQGIAFYFVLVACGSACGLPRQLLAMLGGYAFGAVWGTVLVSAGLAAGCALGFYFARFFAKEYVQGKFANKLRHVELFLGQNPLFAAMAIRCFPVGNNAVTNLLGGVASISGAAFIIGSCIGYLPQSIVFCLLGSGIEVDLVWRSAVSALLFGFSSLFGIHLFRQYRRRLKLQDNEVY